MNRWIPAGCALAISMGAVAAEAAVLVVRSSGPSSKAYPAGKAVSEAQVITLKSNDVVILLDLRGTRNAARPGQVQRDGLGPGDNDLVARGPDRPEHQPAQPGRRCPPSAERCHRRPQRLAGRCRWWSGNICVANPSDLGLYRANAAAAERVTITDGAGKSASVQFSEGQKIASWPTGLPVAAGARYTVKVRRWRKPHRALDRAGAGGPRRPGAELHPQRLPGAARRADRHLRVAKRELRASAKSPPRTSRGGHFLCLATPISSPESRGA